MLTKSANVNEPAVRNVFDRWVAAVQAEDKAGIRAQHDENVLMFDVPPPFVSRGIDAYMATWDLFYESQARPITFDFEDVHVEAGDRIAFITAIGLCHYINKNGDAESLKFRLTMGLRKMNDEWRIVHEHHSVPAND